MALTSGNVGSSLYGMCYKYKVSVVEKFSDCQAEVLGSFPGLVDS